MAHPVTLKQRSRYTVSQRLQVQGWLILMLVTLVLLDQLLLEHVFA